MSYTQADMAKAKRRQERVAAKQGEAHPMRTEGSGIKTMQVDPVLFFNAKEQNEKVYGSDVNCWDDPEFRRDMTKRHPEIKVRTVSRNVMVGGYGARTPGRGRLLPGRGRVTFHKNYGR